MASKSHNVRSDTKRRRKARKPAASGRNPAEAVGDAFDTKGVQRVRAATRANRAAIIGTIFDRFPDPTDQPPQDHDVHNAGEAREAVRHALQTQPAPARRGL